MCLEKIGLWFMAQGTRHVKYFVFTMLALVHVPCTLCTPQGGIKQNLHPAGMSFPMDNK